MTHPYRRSPQPTVNPAKHLLTSSFLALALLATTSCSRIRPHLATQYVYCTAKGGFLRDRIAAVSNRTGTVNNGDKLELLEHGRRFIKVRSPRGEVGWLDEKSVATQDTFDAFAALAAAHKSDPPVASAIVRDEVYMHLKPGRDAERFFRLAEGDKLKLIARATLPKALPPGIQPPRPAAAPQPATKAATQTSAKPLPAPEPPIPAPAMEDWWLVRDAGNRTGWIYSRMMDVDAPDTLTRYAEGQHFVGAYVLTTVNDPDAPQDDKNIPVYLTVLNPYKAGLPYDFDQVRLFIWNTRKHRYETGFREKNVVGFLPVTTGHMKDPYGKGALAQADLPSFTYKVLAAGAPLPVPDPTAGTITPGRLVTRTYRLEGNITHRIAPLNQPSEDVAHPAPPPEKKKAKKNKR